MKIIADTHSHTLASGHAYSTIKEMAAAAKARGLKALALTEHAPEMPGTCGLFYFQNLDVVPRECDGIRLLMGAEVNIMDPDGGNRSSGEYMPGPRYCCGQHAHSVLRDRSYSGGKYQGLCRSHEETICQYHRSSG